MGLGRNLLLWSIRLRWEFSGDYFFCFDSHSSGFALTTFCPQRCRIQPWHAVASSKGASGTPNQSAIASVALRPFMRPAAMRWGHTQVIGRGSMSAMQTNEGRETPSVVLSLCFIFNPFGFIFHVSPQLAGVGIRSGGYKPLSRGHHLLPPFFCSSIQRCRSSTGYRTHRPSRICGISPDAVMPHSLRGLIARASAA